MARATPPSDENRPRSSRRRLRRLVGWSAAVLALALVLAYALRETLLVPPLLALGGDALGGTLTVDSVEGDWFTAIELGGVAFEARDPDAPDAALARVEGGRVEARYSLWRLLRGRLDGLEHLSVSARALELDVRGSGTETEDEPGDATPLPVPAALPAVDVAVESLRVRLAGDQEATARGLAASSEPDGDVRLAADELRWARPDGDPWQTRLELTGTYRKGVLELDPFTPTGVLADDLAFERLRADLQALAGRGPLLEVDATIFRGRFGLTLARAVDGWRGDASIAHLDLAALARRFPERTDDRLAGTIDLDGTFALADAGPSAELQLTATDLTDGKLAIEHAEAVLGIDAELAALEHLVVESGPNRVTAAKVEIPLAGLGATDDDARISGLLRAARGQVQVELGDTLALFPGAERPPTLAASGVFEATLADGALEIRSARLVGEAGRLSGGHGRLVLGPERDPWGGATIDVDYDVEIADLGPLGRLIGRSDWGGSLKGALVLSGPLLAPEGALEGVARDVVVGHWRLDEASVLARTDGSRIEIHELEGHGPNARLTLEGSWDRDTDRLEDVHLVVASEDLSALRQLGAVARLRGVLTLDVTASGPFASPEGRFELAGSRLFGRPDSTIAASGAFSGSHVVLERARIAEGDDRVDVSAVLGRDEAGALAIQLRALSALRAGSTLELAEPATLTVTQRGVEVPGLTLEGDTGSARIALTVAKGNESGSLVLDRFDPTPLLFPWLPTGWSTGIVDATLEFERTGETTRGSLELTAIDARPGAEESPWSVRLAASLAEGRLDVSRCEVQQEGTGGLRASARAPLAPFTESVMGEGPFALDLTFRAPDVARWQRWFPDTSAHASGELRLDARLRGDWSAVSGRIAAHAEGLSLRFDEPAPASGFRPEHMRRPAALENGALSIELAVGEAVRIATGSLRTAELGTIALTGSLGGRLDPSALVRGDTSGLLDAPLDANAVLDLPDASTLRPFTPGVRRLEGVVAGSLDVAGTPRAPSLVGDLELKEGGLRLEADFPPIEALEGRLAFAGSRVELEDMTGELGAGPFRIRGSLDGSGDEPVLELSAKGENVLLARRPGMRVRADADLEVRGPLGRLETTGEVVLTDGFFGRDYDLFGFLSTGGKPTAGARGFSPTFWRRPPLADMRMDVRITSREPFVARNNLLSGAARPQLTVRGTAEVPLFIGSVYLDPTRVSLPSGTLVIESGLIEFLEADPFVPRIRLTGTVRTSGYEIQVDVSGSYLAPEIVLTSIPPLPDDQLLLLFLTGELPPTAASDRSMQAAESIASFLARDLIAKRFTGGDGGSSLMERFEIEWGTEVSRSGASTARVQFLLDDRPTGPGRVPYLAAESDRYDKINFGIGWLFRFK